MSHGRQRHEDGSAGRQRSIRADRHSAGRAGRPSSAGARRVLMIFALGLIMALGAVVMLIAAGTVQALPHTAALHAKADGWVGLAATFSVLASAAAGVVLVQRYVGSRRR